VRLEKSRDKLGEARFFLARLSEVPDPRKLPNRFAPNYYFSAFLNAGYSTIKFVEAEVKIRLRQENPPKSKSNRQYEEWKKTWRDALADDEEKRCWDSLTQEGGLRAREVHVERTKTATKEKMIPLESFPNDNVDSRQKQEYEAYYSMRQQVAPFYPGIQATKDETSRSRFAVRTDITLSVLEHYTEMGGSFQRIVEICEKQAALLESFICHFERLLP